MHTLYNCGAEYTTVTCKNMVKGFIAPFAKGTTNIKAIFLFEVNFDIKHSIEILVLALNMTLAKCG